MSDETTPAPERQSDNWLKTLMEGGGLPQVLAGPAGKAIARLIGVTVEIPAAYGERFVRGIRDETDAQSIVTNALAEQAAKQAVKDPAVMERAMNSMLSRSYRAQLNKDQVAAFAVEDLSENTAPSDSESPSDEWLDNFERYAEEASSSEVQFLFGKILGSETREPGSISANTLHFVSMLEKETASLIDKVLPYCLADAALLELMEPQLTHQETMVVEQAGFFTSGQTWTVGVNQNNQLKLHPGKNFAVVVEVKPNSKITFRAAMLSRPGIGLVKSLNPKFKLNPLLKTLIKNPTVKQLHYGQTVDIEDGFRFVNAMNMQNPDFKE